MKTQRILIILLVWLLPALVFSQVLSGKISENNAQGKETSLPMAGMKWTGTAITATADENGSFQIQYPDSMPAKLIVSMVGYKNDTLVFHDKAKTNIKILLKSSATTLADVNIIGKQQSTSNLINAPINTERITKEELTLAACCNLSESFERNASVDVNFTDAVSGSKQIQMLGLDGIYTQILYENLPFVRGLSSSYGLSYIPGPWVENILVTKGTGSVVNGYESITGQIQIELLEPDKAERLFVNGYTNSESRWEGNAHLTKRLNDNMSTILFLHANKNYMRLDKNKDSFLDIPLTTQLNAFNRWNFQFKRIEGQFGFRVMTENRDAGQINFDHRIDTLNTNNFGIGIQAKQFETFTKTGFLFPNKPWKSIAIMTTERYHKQDAFFGLKKYNGEQKSLYVNTIWADIIGNTAHKIKFGGSMLMDNYEETFNDGIKLISDSAHNDLEIVPGGYAEYTFNNDTNLSIVAGMRGDYINGDILMINPRLHLKYNPTADAAIRIAGGRGMRTSHIFVENSAVFASSREVIIAEKLLPEVAWNYGMTFTYCFKPFGREASINFDLFRTDFERQTVIDLEDADKVQFYNLKGVSYSNSFQTDFSISPTEKLDIKLAYKYYDVKTSYVSAGQTTTGKLLDKPLVPKNRALLNIDYKTNHEKWKFNLTTKWFGKSRLPNTSTNSPEFQLPEYSNNYYTLMAQVTKKFRWIEFYIGGENLLDYTIPNPIIDPQNPFGTNFDATMIWGPINGRVIYAGFRYKII